MSLWRDDPPPSGATLAALIGVSAVAVVSLSRVFVGPRYLAWALPALVIGAAFAFLFGRRSLGIGFGLLALAWILTLPVLFARDTTTAGFPTWEAMRAVRRLFGSGFVQAPKVTAPLEATPRYLIIVWTAFLFLGFLGASWVVVRRPLGAIISALGVVTFAGSIGDGPGRTPFALAAVAATGAFFLAEGRQRISRWAAGGLRVPVWFGIPTLGVGCAFALAAPFILGETPVVQLRPPLRPRVVIIKPLSDIRRQLKVDPPLEVLRVTSLRPTYWRLTSLDTYDGREWKLEARPRTIRNGVVGAPDPPPTGDVIEQHYRLTSLLSPWMPAAYAARSVQADATVDVDESSQTLLLRGEKSPGLNYTVTSQLPHVAANAEGRPAAVSDPTEKLLGDVARPIVAGVRTPLETATRLEQHFRRFAYNEDVEGGHSVQRLQRFLAERSGYCEQFAATMTLMLRGLGINARVGVGFLPGAQLGGEFLVTTREAHAWVEANIPGAGWTTFDPTPGRGNASSAPPDESRQGTPPPAPQVTEVPASTPQRQEFPDELSETSSAGIPRAVVWLVVAVVILGVVPLTKRVRRSVRRSGDPRSATLGAYEELSDRARELGWSAEPSETHSEFAMRAAGAEHRAAASIATLASRAVFAPSGVGAEHARSAWKALPAAVGAMRSRARWWRLVTAAIDPRTLLPAAARSWARSLLRSVRPRFAG